MSAVVEESTSKPICGQPTKTNSPCQRSPLQGKSHCKDHGPNEPTETAATKVIYNPLAEPLAPQPKHMQFKVSLKVFFQILKNPGQLFCSKIDDNPRATELQLDALIANIENPKQQKEARKIKQRGPSINDGFGQVYVFTKERHPDLVKIGRTARNTRKRVAEQSSYDDVATIIYDTFVTRNKLAENLIHKLLQHINPKVPGTRRNTREREWFKTVDFLKDILPVIVVVVAYVNEKYPEP